jgi:cytochrome P450
MSDPNTDAPSTPKYDILGPQFHADPHPTLHRMRAEDPVYWHPLLKLWILTRYDDIQLIVRDRRFSAERADQFGFGASDAMKEKIEVYTRFIGRWMVFSDPPRHTVMRSLIGKAFTPQVIERLAPLIEALANEMLDVVEGAGEMDVVRDIAFPLPAITIATMLGVPRQDADAFRSWTNDVFVLLGAGVATDEAIEAGYRGVVALEEYFRSLIAARRKEPTEDLLSLLIAAEEQGTVMTEAELVSTCAMLLAAGHETTTHLIGNAVLALLQHPDEMRKLRDNPALIEDAVDEALRYESAASMLSRRALEDVEVGGVLIRAGELAMGMIHAGNHDPAHFEDPDRFDISRKGPRSLGFGHGIHFCIGAALARLEIRIALEAILRRLPGLALATESPERLQSVAIRGLAALPVTFRPRGATEDATRGEHGPLSWRGPVSLQSPLSARAPMSVPSAPPQIDAAQGS